jgi:hypothetical protein
MFERRKMYSRAPLPFGRPRPRSRYEPNTIASAPHSRAAWRILAAIELTGAFRTPVLTVAPWRRASKAAASTRAAASSAALEGKTSSMESVVEWYDVDHPDVGAEGGGE